MTRFPTRLPTRDRNRLLVRAAGALVVTLMSTGAGCPGGSGGSTGSTGDFGTDTDFYATSTGDDPSTTMTTTTMSTTEPSTTTMSTTMSTTDNPTDSDPTTDSDPSADSTDTDPSGCLSTGDYTAVRSNPDDPLGHFQYLKLFYAPDAPNQIVDETLSIEVGADGTITVNVLPRASGSGEGHAGLADLGGTIDDACNIAIDTTAIFESDTGPFDEISVVIAGSTDLTMTLSGGFIPQGPITYNFTLVPVN